MNPATKVTRRQKIKVHTITPTLKLLNLQPPIAGYEKFIGAYLFCAEKNVIIDAGPKAAIPNLFSTLNELGINPKQIDYIMLTHIHIDHAGGVGTALKEMTNAKVITHERARPHLIDPTILWEASLKTLGDLALEYGIIEPIPEDKIVIATDGMKLDLGAGPELEIYLTPGHAVHHLSIFNRADNLLIAGEAAGVCINGNIRPATPPPFRLEETISSIEKLITLKPQKLCYGHFGCYDNGLERLRLYREKILKWREIISSAIKIERNPEEILTLLRGKDKDLNYLDNLDKYEYNREYALIINTISGLTWGLST